MYLNILKINRINLLKQNHHLSDSNINGCFKRSSLFNLYSGFLFNNYSINDRASVDILYG